MLCILVYTMTYTCIRPCKRTSYICGETKNDFPQVPFLIKIRSRKAEKIFAYNAIVNSRIIQRK